jgi:tetratricopeptide (TPR) repeat protein
MGSNAKDWFNQGLSYLSSQNHERAIEAFSEALKGKRDFTEAYYNRGLTWYKKGDPQRALADFKTALCLEPESSTTQDMIAKIEAMIRG